MRAKPVPIGDRFFPRQSDALGFFKEMLGRYNIGETVSPDDVKDLDALLSRHRDVVGKIGCGISHYKVQSDGYGGRCFWIVRVDHSEVDFSYRRCITEIW